MATRAGRWGRQEVRRRQWTWIKANRLLIAGASAWFGGFAVLAYLFLPGDFGPLVAGALGVSTFWVCALVGIKGRSPH